MIISRAPLAYRASTPITTVLRTPQNGGGEVTFGQSAKAEGKPSGLITWLPLSWQLKIVESREQEVHERIQALPQECHNIVHACEREIVDLVRDYAQERGSYQDEVRWWGQARVDALERLCGNYSSANILACNNDRKTDLRNKINETKDAFNKLEEELKQKRSALTQQVEYLKSVIAQRTETRCEVSPKLAD